MLNIEEKSAPVNQFALFNLGFRPFFLGAAAFAVVAMVVWMGILVFGWPLQFGDLAPATWHAHEMIYGYATAVIAGFLLTAVQNWTGVGTVHQRPLMLLFLLWFIGRLLPFGGDGLPLPLYATLDSAFLLLVFFAVLHPVLKSRQWNQMGVITKVLLLFLSNGLFYLGALGVVADGEHMGLYSGFYMVIALILVLARRVLPFFIEKGVGYPVELKNRPWLDISSLIVFLLFWISDVFLGNVTLAGWLGGILFALHLIRIIGWHTPGIWKKPLLWSLYLAYASITAGFALKFVLLFVDVPPPLVTHTFAVGGIALVTIGMMARVALGHTGRSVFEPPPILSWMFLMIVAAAIFRVVIPLLTQQHHLLWIGISQALWITAFSLFLGVYFPVLLRPRVDGRYG